MSIRNSNGQHVSGGSVRNVFGVTNLEALADQINGNGDNAKALKKLMRTDPTAHLKLSANADHQPSNMMAPSCDVII